MYCIVSAMEDEIACFIKEYQPSIIQSKPFKIYQKEEILIIITGIGLVNSACATTFILTKFPSIKILINVGTCGSIDKSLNPLSKVFVKEATYSTANATAFGYEMGQIPRMPKAFTTYNCEVVNDYLIRNFSSVTIASSDNFINSISQQQLLEKQFQQKINVVDMECTAILQCAYNFEIPVLAFKIVSDSIFLPSSEKQFNETLQKCSEIIATTLFELIKILPIEKIKTYAEK